MKLFPSLRISQKLPLALVGSAVIVGAGVAIVSYLLASQVIDRQAREQLTTIAVERANQLGMYVDSLTDSVVKSGRSDSVVQAIGDFTKAIDQVKGDDPLAVLREAYPAAVPELLDGEPPAANTSDPALIYKMNDARYLPVFRELKLADGLSDLYLFDIQGQMVYSTGKRGDLFGNAADPASELGATGLGQAYRAASAIESPGEAAFVDFAAYPFRSGKALAFMAKPVFSVTGKRLGVFAAGLPSTQASALVASQRGLGTTGAIAAVGADGAARTSSRLSSDVLQPVDGAVAALAASGTTVGDVSTAQGRALIAATAPIEVAPGVQWTVVAAMDRAEVLAPANQLALTMVGVGTGLLFLVAGLGWLLARNMTRPITRLTRTMHALASGDLDVPVQGQERRDEIGAMARSVEVFRASARQVEAMSEDERAAEERRRDDRARMMQELQRAFGQVVDAAVRGDFSRRVAAEFPDAELNSLADSVNNLVDTVERGLDETGTVLAALARADLTQRVTGHYEGAFGRLRDDTNNVCDTLSQTLQALKLTSGALKTATGELLDGANDLSQRTTRQGQTVEETSAAMGQLAVTVGENARRAEAASAKARAVSQSATEGGAVMDKATAAMERITDSANRISSIIRLIDDIAFQTNLLALNASVEAARAGEAGKGFAVVAVEVRRLAQSAAQASSEVKGLIEQSGTEVEGGSRLVAEAAKRLLAMLEAARESSTLIDGIAAASREQAMAIREVSGAVRSLDEMTQHNAALVEETNAAVEQTEMQARELDRIIETFAVDTEGEIRRRAA